MSVLRFPDPALELFARESAKVIESVDEIILERLAQIGLRLDSQDASPRSVRGAIAASAKFVEREVDVTELSKDVINLADEFHKDEVARSFRDAGAQMAIRPEVSDEALRDFRTTLARRYEESIGEHLEFVERVTVEGVKDGRRAADIAEQFAERSEAAQTKLELLARDTLGTLKSFQDVERMQKLGVERYRWLTSEDERVRDTHAALNGSIQRFDQPPLVGHPGEDWMCRCVEQPLIGV